LIMMGKDFPNPFGLTTQKEISEWCHHYGLSCFPGNQGGPLMHILLQK
jgi:glycine hydroxymethyltransferase